VSAIACLSFGRLYSRATAPAGFPFIVSILARSVGVSDKFHSIMPTGISRVITFFAPVTGFGIFDTFLPTFVTIGFTQS